MKASSSSSPKRARALALTGSPFSTYQRIRSTIVAVRLYSSGITPLAKEIGAVIDKVDVQGALDKTVRDLDPDFLSPLL